MLWLIFFLTIKKVWYWYMQKKIKLILWNPLVFHLKYHTIIYNKLFFFQEFEENIENTKQIENKFQDTILKFEELENSSMLNNIKKLCKENPVILPLPVQIQNGVSYLILIFRAKNLFPYPVVCFNSPVPSLVGLL